jgi:hypothetical protein
MASTPIVHPLHDFENVFAANVMRHRGIRDRTNRARQWPFFTVAFVNGKICMMSSKSTIIFFDNSAKRLCNSGLTATPRFFEIMPIFWIVFQSFESRAIRNNTLSGNDITVRFENKNVTVRYGSIHDADDAIIASVTIIAIVITRVSDEIYRHMRMRPRSRDRCGFHDAETVVIITINVTNVTINITNLTANVTTANYERRRRR